jgi:hypothetical protein
VIPDRGLSNSVGNVIHSLDTLSYNSYGQVSALDFMHFTLLEYQRLQLKAYNDEEIMHKQRERKLAEVTVPPIDKMFYKDPSIIIRNFDFENSKYVSQLNYNTPFSNGEVVDGIDVSLLRIAAPTSRLQNNPPKTREEQRKERMKERNQEEINELDQAKGPKVIKISKKNVDTVAAELNEREQFVEERKKIIKKVGNAQKQNIFSQNNPYGGSSNPLEQSPNDKVKDLETKLHKLDVERGTVK